MHFFIIRLLDVSACARNQTLDLTLVFEYIDQDLTSFMNCAEHGLSREKIKVKLVGEDRLSRIIEDFCFCCPIVLF